jgi:hypothetical protein
MIETISPWPSVRLRHESAPLLKEREQYLKHLLQLGYSRVSVRNTAAYLVHVVRLLNMNSMRIGPLRKKVSPRGSPRVFVQVAHKWLRFHGQLETAHRIAFIEWSRSLSRRCVPLVDLLRIQSAATAPAHLCS